MKLHLLIPALLSFNVLVAQSPIENFKSDILFLSSDSLEGRLTGSKGEEISANYIASEFKKYGLTNSGGSDFIQTFTTVGRKFLDKGTVQLKKLNSNGEEESTAPEIWYPMSQSSTLANFTSELYFAGYGIHAPKLNHSDYPDTLAAKGKVFVIKLGFPASNNPHSPIVHYSGVSNKIKTAIGFGAKAIVFIPDNNDSDIPKKEISRNVTATSVPVLFVKMPEIEIKSFTKINCNYNIKTTYATGHNVVGHINNNAKYNVVIGAHHDHLGHGEYGGSRKPDSKEIHNGADDNASGVAMMLQIMREISKKKDLKFNYTFMAFSGEEMGLIGSKHIVKMGGFDSLNTNCMINFDMVGRLKKDKKVLLVNGIGTSTEWEGLIKKAHIDTTAFSLKTTKSGTGASDHTAFYLNGIPVLHLFTGQHYEYHTPADDEHLINYEGMKNILEYTMQLVTSLEGMSKLNYQETKSESDGRISFKVTLGVMPDYVFEGPGLKIDAVSNGKAAHKAGILAGDIVLKMAEVEIANIYDYTKCLSMFNKGQKVVVEVKRNDEIVKIPVVF